MPISVDRCSFTYRRGVPVLRDFSISFGSGATVLLGPNGAGKSTLLGIAATLLRPASGTLRMDEIDPRRNRATYRKAVGWMPQQIQAVPGLTVREQVAYAGWLKGLSKADAWSRSIEGLRAVSLASLASRRSHELSGGQLRRMGLAQSLVHDARVVLMDEPTAGLDPEQRDRFRELIGNLIGRVSIIVSTHQTEDLTQIFDHVAVISEGSLRFHGSTAEFLANAQTPGADQALSAYRHFIGREV